MIVGACVFLIVFGVLTSCVLVVCWYTVVRYSVCLSTVCRYFLGLFSRFAVPVCWYLRTMFAEVPMCWCTGTLCGWVQYIHTTKTHTISMINTIFDGVLV